VSGLLVAILLAVLLIAGTVLFHYEGLKLTSHIAQHEKRKGARNNTLIVIFSVMFLHLVEIGLYGFAYWLGDAVFDIGDFAGRAVGWKDYMYYSAENFTTLGLGDIYPVGDLRLITSIESLNGLLLLAWSGSFTYIAMRRYWDAEEHNTIAPR
jgi:hypothetical protein